MNQALRERSLARHVASQSRPLRPRLPRPDAPAPFRGWAVVAGAFLVTMVGFGAVYSYAAFAEEIGAAFSSSRASISIVYALSGGSCFFVSAPTGPLADRIGARILAVVGMLLVGLGFLVAAAATSLVEVYVGYGVLVGLGCGFGYVPAIAAVQRCLNVHRGLASGIAVSGIGIGTALVPPVAEAFSAIGDWRKAFVACGALAALIGVGGALLLTPVRQDCEAAPAPRPTPPAFVLSRDFGLVYAGTLLVSVPSVLPHAMLVGTARDMGLDRHDAVSLLGLIGRAGVQLPSGPAHFLVPCFSGSRSPAPQSFGPVLPTSRWTASPSLHGCGCGTSSVPAWRHRVRLPRWLRPVLYSRHFRTLRFCLGIWWRRSSFSLDGKTVSGVKRGATLLRRPGPQRHRPDPCNTAGKASERGRPPHIVAMSQ
jgi:MFS family permease